MRSKTKSYDNILPGDKVTVVLPAGLGRHGREMRAHTGRAVMRGPAGWVLNLGGKHGTPAIASETNTIRVVDAPKKPVGRAFIRGDWRYAK